MHFDMCQFDYFAKYARFAPKCRKKHCFYIFTNNLPYEEVQNITLTLSMAGIFRTNYLLILYFAFYVY